MSHRAQPKLLPRSKVMRVLAQMGQDASVFWAHYTALSRGLTPERIRAVEDYDRDHDLVKLMKRLGTKSTATAFKAVGQVSDYLNRLRNGGGTPVPAAASLMRDYVGELERGELSRDLDDVEREMEAA